MMFAEATDPKRPPDAARRGQDGVDRLIIFAERTQFGGRWRLLRFRISSATMDLFFSAVTVDRKPSRALREYNLDRAAHPARSPPS
jgi:hypothetical protein